MTTKNPMKLKMLLRLMICAERCLIMNITPYAMNILKNSEETMRLIDNRFKGSRTDYVNGINILIRHYRYKLSLKISV